MHQISWWIYLTPQEQTIRVITELIYCEKIRNSCFWLEIWMQNFWLRNDILNNLSNMVTTTYLHLADEGLPFPVCFAVPVFIHTNNACLWVTNVHMKYKCKCNSVYATGAEFLKCSLYTIIYLCGESNACIKQLECFFLCFQLRVHLSLLCCLAFTNWNFLSVKN